jgi:hypothetical protein
LLFDGKYTQCFSLQPEAGLGWVGA